MQFPKKFQFIPNEHFDGFIFGQIQGKTTFVWVIPFFWFLVLAMKLQKFNLIFVNILQGKMGKTETSSKGISTIKPEMGILRSLSSINKDLGNFGKPFNSRIFT